MDGVVRRRPALAQEVPVPLPLKGLFADARTARIQGIYAARLQNLRSDGVKITTMPTFGLTDHFVRRRVPYQFGASSLYIDLQESVTEAGDAVFDRALREDATVAYISAQAIMADGNGKPLLYNGDTLTESDFVTVTTTTAEMLDGVLVHQDRPYLWRYGGTLEFYYGDVGAVTGPITLFPLSRLGNITGQIAGIVSLTQDASENVNDSLCVLTTTGQIVIYEGTNPGDATDWRLAGRVQAAPPISKFGYVNVGGDVWMITDSGLVSVLQSWRQGVMALVGNLARPISEEIKALVATGGEWQLHQSARGEFIIINHYLNGASRQFIYDVQGQGWHTANYPARRWHNLGGQTEFTTATGRLGRLGAAGDPLVSTWWSSWFPVRSGSQIAWLKPNIIATGPMEVQIAVLSDNNTSAADVAEATQTVTLYPEDPADPGGQVALNEIIGVGAVGDRFQIRMTITAADAELISMTAGIA